MQGFINCMGGTRKRAQGAIAEVLEGRRLLSTVSYEYDYDPYYAASGTIQIGDNTSWQYGYDPEMSASIGSSQVWGHYVWDDEPEDGVQQLDEKGKPKPVPVELTVTLGTTDTISMTVGGLTGTTGDQDILTSIQKVVIEAYAYSMGVEFRWSNLQVDFYRDGEVVDSASDLVDPRASTMDYSQWSAFEGVQITTEEIGCDKVVVSGFVQLTTDSPYFYPNDIFGQILIY